MSILHHFQNISPEELRKEVEKQLQWAYAHNHISITELERRLDILNRTEDKTEILSLVENLPLPAGDEQSQTTTNFQESETESDSFFTLLGSNTRRGQWDVPRQLDVAAVLGSQVLDFREARFCSGTTIIKAFTFMGSIEMKFSPGVRVTSKGIPILGSIENKVQSESSGPLIHIDGFVIMGSIDAKTKKG